MNQTSTAFYKASFLLSTAIFVLATLLQLATGSLEGLHYPHNVTALAVLSTLLVGTHLIAGQSLVLRWLSSIPAALSSIALLFFLVLLMGIFDQNAGDHPLWQELLGLNSMKNSWQMAASLVYLLTTLGLVTLRRLSPFSLKNLSFFVSHAGLWIIVSAIGFGGPDLSRLYIDLNEGEAPHSAAYDENNNATQLPFSLRLQDFYMAEYSPKIAAINPVTYQALPDIKPNFELITDLRRFNARDWDVAVLEYLPRASYGEWGFEAGTGSNTVPAARIGARNNKSKEYLSGWISGGSVAVPYSELKLDSSMSIALARPSPKEFRSKIGIYEGGKLSADTLVRVNEPFDYAGWTLYQVSFDSKQGRSSKRSTLEAIHDPWLPVVYLGIGMMLVGAFFLLVFGKFDKTAK